MHGHDETYGVAVYDVAVIGRAVIVVVCNWLTQIELVEARRVGCCGRHVRPRDVVRGDLEGDDLTCNPVAGRVFAERSVNREGRINISCADVSSRIERRSYRGDGDTDDVARGVCIGGTARVGRAEVVGAWG